MNILKLKILPYVIKKNSNSISIINKQKSQYFHNNISLIKLRSSTQNQFQFPKHTSKKFLTHDSLVLNSLISESNSKVISVPLETQKKYYWNQCFDKGRLKNFVLWFFRNNGEHKTIQLVEEFKNLGFQYATKAGISLGIEDLKIPPKKASLIFSAEKETSSAIKQYKRGDITGVERFQCLIDTWHRTSEQLKQEVIDNFEATDILNPVYMMAFSGARGNISQVRQLVGMRGLMSNPQGQIIDFPIRSNFREGLTLTEYIISSYGARKGIVDTALRTANAGYLTRRLVDVAQHVIISNFDCGTRRGIFLKDMKEGNKTIVSLNTRLIGRVCGSDIYKNNDSLKSITKIATRNQEISIDLAFEISKVTKKVFIRSALTCETKKLVCQLCYGWSLAQGNLVSIGEAIGVIAAQSIGEPGTQLTMRTFHTGGVFSGDVTDQIRMPFFGMIIYNAPIPGTLIRTPEGKIAFLTKAEGSFTVCEISEINEEKQVLEKLSERNDTGFTSVKLSSMLPKGSQTKKFKIPAFTLLYAKNGDFFKEKEVVAQISSISKQKNATDEAELTIKSELDGELHINSLEVKENKVGPKLTKKEKETEETLATIQKPLVQTAGSPLTQFLMNGKKNSFLVQKNGPTNLMESYFEAWTWGNAWILSGKIYHSPTPSAFFPMVGDFINKNSLMNGPNPLKYFSMVSGESKLEYVPNSFPKYLQPKKIEKSSSSIKISTKNNYETLSKLLEIKTNSKEKNFPTLNNPFLNFSIKNLTYKNIGYYLRLNDSFQFKPTNPLTNLNKFAKQKIEFKKHFNQNQNLNPTDSIFVIPENHQLLVNKSLLKLYPSNWQPQFKTIVEWFPSKLKIPTNGILAKEEISIVPSSSSLQKQKSSCKISNKKKLSLFSLHKFFLTQNLKLQHERSNKQIQNIKSLSKKVICLSKNSDFESLKITKIQLNVNKILKVHKLNKQINLGTINEMQWKSSRLLFSPTVKKSNLEKQIHTKPRSLKWSSQKEQFVKYFKEHLQLKKQEQKFTKSISLGIKNDTILKKSRVKNLKCFCILYLQSLKKQEKQNSSMQNCIIKKNNTNYSLQTNAWVYFVPKKQISNKMVPHTKYLIYPGQSYTFGLSFDNHLISVFADLICSTRVLNSNQTKTTSIQIIEKPLTIQKWIQNKNCRYSLSNKDILMFVGQRNNFLPSVSTSLNNKFIQEEYYGLVFQQINELNLNFLTNSNQIDLKTEIYEISKTSDNPLNNLMKINIHSSKKNDKPFSQFKKKGKVFTQNSQIYGSVKLFTNNTKKNKSIKQTSSINLPKKIQELNVIFSKSPDFENPSVQIKSLLNQINCSQSLNSNSKPPKMKIQPNLLFNSLFNKSFFSLTQFKLFKNAGLNKQESSLQLLSKYPNLDINLMFQFSKNLKFNNLFSNSSKSLLKQNFPIKSDFSFESSIKTDIKSPILDRFNQKELNLFNFYITISSENQENLGLKNKTTKTLLKTSSYRLFDYPFKDYKIYFTKNSFQFPTKRTKNYLTKILFKDGVCVTKEQKSTQPNSELSTLNFSNLGNDDSKRSEVLNLNDEINSLIQFSTFRSVLGYSLEQLVNKVNNPEKTTSNPYLISQKKLKNKYKRLNNESLSVIKFYGIQNFTVSPLVPFAKNYSYSPFEGEIIKITSPYSFSKKDKNSLKIKFYLENKSMALQQKQHVSVFLTKNDLISYSFQKTKNNSNYGTQNLFYRDNNTFKSSLKSYLIKDLILPISSQNLKESEENEKLSQLLDNKSTPNNESKDLYQIPELVAGYPLSKAKQTQRGDKKSFLKVSGLKGKNISFNLNNSDDKTKTLQKLNQLNSSDSSLYQIGDFIVIGDKIFPPNSTEKSFLQTNSAVSMSGQIIHLSNTKLTIRKGQPLFISPKSILHKLDGEFIESKSPVITLTYQRLKTGDIVQGIPKIEQFFEARTTKRGRLFRDSLPNLLKALFKRYLEKMPLEKAVRQSFYKIQQIIVDGVLRVYRSQGVTIADKHLEIIVKQMTSKVRILEGGQTGFFPGEVVDLEFVEQVNELLMKKIQYEPLVLGITKSSLEVDSFLSAASFQQTTRVLSHAAIARKKDFLKGLKENVILGNLIPAGTGYLVCLEEKISR